MSSSGRLKKVLQPDTHDPRCGAAGISQDDAVLISDDESEYCSDLDDRQFDTTFPPIDKLLQITKCNDESGDIAGTECT